ncbi:MAG: SDR family NAD(P)-dependent oxidoreductase, partial [Planctomycetota bacterium]
MSIVALIIGGTGGIGGAVSRLFSENDAKVYSTYFKNYEKSLKMKDLLNKCEVLYCDITKEEDVKEVVENVLQRDSRIDVVVNCATSNLKLKPFDQLTRDEFSSDIHVILNGGVN